MNDKNINTQVYAQKVELLLRLMPIIMDEGVFAVHGGTAINLFHFASAEIGSFSFGRNRQN